MQMTIINICEVALPYHPTLDLMMVKNILIGIWLQNKCLSPPGSRDTYEFNKLQISLRIFPWWYVLATINALPGTQEQLKEQCVIVLFLFIINDFLRKMQRLLQVNMSVQEYYKEFQKCRSFCEINEYVEATENIFLHDLRHEIQNILIDHSYNSFS